MSKSPSRIIQVHCGELCKSSECTPDELNLLNYAINDLEPNVTIGYEGFIFDPHTLSDRILDLLQISSMVFCADRMSRRGERESISNGSWARSFEFHISVLDHEFWNQDIVRKTLSEALCFMTGDRSFTFDFQKAELGHFEEKKNQQRLGAETRDTPRDDDEHYAMGRAVAVGLRRRGIMTEQIINPMDLYWIGTLDAVDTFALIMAVMFGITFIAMVIGVIYNLDMMSVDEDNKRYYKICKACSIVSGILFLVFAVAAIFIPDKATMIEMMVAKYATRENIQLTTDGIKEVVDYIIDAIATLK